MKENQKNKLKSSWKTKSRNATTGYTLHAKRFLYTGKTGIRSFKLPLKNKNPEVFNDFAQKIKNDYICQVGLINLYDWNENHNKEGQYSVIDFWLDSLRTGVIFSHKKESTQDLIEKINSSNGNVLLIDKFEAELKKSNEDLYKVADIKNLFEFFRSNSRGGDLKFNFKKEARESKIVKDWIKTLSTVSNKEKNNFVKSLVGFSLVKDSCFEHNFFFHPSLNFTKNLSSKGLISKYCNFIKENQSVYDGKDFGEKLDMVLGFFNNHGAFSKYFNETLKVFREKPESLVEQISDLSPYWKKNRKELENRIYFLRDKALLIKGTELASPHEYRSSFGGKIQSLVSNFLRQEKDIKDQLFGFYEEKVNGAQQKFVEGNEQELNKIIKSEDEYEIKAISKESKNLAIKCLNLISELKSEITDDKLGLYRQLIGELRTRLNVEFQNAFPELNGKNEKERNNDANKKRADRKYQRIFKDIKLIPNFLGETKRKVYGKYLKSADIIHEGIRFIDSIDTQIPDNLTLRFSEETEIIEFAERQFETLRRKYYEMNSTRFRNVISSVFDKRKFVDLKKKEDGILKTITDNSFYLKSVFIKEGGVYKNEEYYAFYLNPRARDQRRTLIKLDIDERNALKILKDLISCLKPRWRDVVDSNDFGEIIDAVEMEKVRLGILVALYDQHQFIIEKKILNPELFESAHAYLKLENNPKKISGQILGRFLQSMVCSEMKGAINKISRTEYIERYIAQPMNTEQNYPLFLNRNDKNTWHVIDKEKVSKKLEDALLPVELKIGKEFTDKDEDYSKCYINKDDSFNIISSKYQLQFLTKALIDKNKSWWNRKGIDLSMSSYSFIFEQRVLINWNVKERSFKLTALKNNKENNTNERLFVSIPFEIKPKSAKVNNLLERKRYMGIDVGEYGLAYTIIDTDQKNKKVNKILKQGFIYEPLTHKVRDYVKSLKDSQVRGTFGMADTKLMRLRENAITSLRNQVHHIAMRYDAIPIYEYEISNFETGGNKVKVIYDSVKRADVGRGGTDADKAESDLVWGKKGKNFGRQIGAYATSYICTECCYSPYQEIDKKIEKENKIFSRPSIEEFLKTHPSFKNEKILQKSGVKDGEWKTKRGNSAIYVCKRCGHISDADIQASYWIALKRFKKDFSDKDDKKNKDVELKELVELHSKNSITKMDFLM